jgi:hypothetical protein
MRLEFSGLTFLIKPYGLLVVGIVIVVHGQLLTGGDVVVSDEVYLFVFVVCLVDAVGLVAMIVQGAVAEADRVVLVLLTPEEVIVI